MTTDVGQVAVVVDDGTTVTVTGGAYRWRWRRDDDVVELRDAADRLMARGPLTPGAIVAREGERRVLAGGAVTARVDGDRLTVSYGCGITLTLRFAADAVAIEPVTVPLDDGDEVVELTYFASVTGERARPALRHTYLVHPGVCEASSVSPVLPTETGLELTSWLGRGSMGPDSRISQQWGLPAHFYCGVNRDCGHNARSSATSRRSAAFCVGLAELPAGDLMLRMGDGAASPVLRVRGDLWHHVAGPGEVRLGGELLVTVGDDYRAAIRAYYRELAERDRAGADGSAVRRRAATASQFNTWGAQCAVGREAARFDQDTLETIYAGMRASGLRPELFVVDDKWEGEYGALAHDPDRFPRFERFLERVRADGFGIGLWAAFLRVNDPASLGLGPEHLMRDRDGRPIEKPSRFEARPYFLLDVSQQVVADGLRQRIGRFVRRYDPDLVKFDFGYELPSLAVSAPADPHWAGERMLGRALDVVVGALRDVKPDIAVMYYALSPLLTRQVDQHSHDDLYLCVDDYAAEGNRRLFFSSLLGELGVPTYGSTGYDWASAPDHWFDTAVAGPVGSLNAFGGDERDETPTPAVVARFNGLAATARRTTLFRVEPVTPVSIGSITGARSSSWLRYEENALVAAAVRPVDRDAAAIRGAGMDTDVPVVVTSLTGEALPGARRLGVVPFGTGTFTIATDNGATVRATAHLLDGREVAGRVQHHDRTLVITVDERVESTPVTWIEIDRGSLP